MMSFLGYLCATQSTIPSGLVKFNVNHLKLRYDEIILRESLESSWALSKLLISECSTANVKSIINFCKGNLRDAYLSASIKVNILQLILVISQSYDYNALLIARSSLLSQMYDLVIFAHKGSVYNTGKFTLIPSLATLSEYSLNLIQTLSNSNSYGHLTIYSIPYGVGLLISKARKLKSKLYKMGICHVIDTSTIPSRFNSRHDTIGDSTDLLRILPFETKIRQLQENVTSVEDEMLELSLFDVGTVDAYKCTELVSKLDLYEHQARLLIEDCLNCDDLKDYTILHDLFEHIVYLSTTCLNHNNSNAEPDAVSEATESTADGGDEEEQCI